MITTNVHLHILKPSQSPSPKMAWEPIFRKYPTLNQNYSCHCAHYYCIYMAWEPIGWSGPKKGLIYNHAQIAVISSPSQGLPPPPHTPFFGITCKPWSKQIIFFLFFIFFGCNIGLFLLRFWITKMPNNSDQGHLWRESTMNIRLRTSCTLSHLNKWFIDWTHV